MFYDEMGLKQLKLTCLHEETSPRSKLLKKMSSAPQLLRNNVKMLHIEIICGS